MTIRAVIFDLGGVVNQWQPERALANHFSTLAEAARSLVEGGFGTWVDATIDAGLGREAALAAAPLAYRPVFAAYLDNIAEAHSQPVPGTREIILELKANGLRLLAMSNAGAAAWDALRANLPVTGEFDDVFISGVEGLKKPAPGAFQALLQRNDLATSEALFIDDSQRHVEAARALGLDAIRFEGANSLRAGLSDRGLL